MYLVFESDKLWKVDQGEKNMLQVLSRISSKRATDYKRGNVQQFLERLLVEIVAENYRYFLAQHLWYEEESTKNGTDTWTPLLNGEREVSGLFAAALSRVSPISSPEFPITRAKSSEDGEALSGGRVDYVACFGNREVGLELKQHAISTKKGSDTNEGLRAKWDSVESQSRQVLKYMRKDGFFESPVSIGLLVIRVGCKVNRNIARKEDWKTAFESARADAEKGLIGEATTIKKALKPDFLAYYKAPYEMQISSGWGENEDEYRLYPGIIFAGVVHESTKGQAKPTR